MQFGINFSLIIQKYIQCSSYAVSQYNILDIYHLNSLAAINRAYIYHSNSLAAINKAC